MILVVAKKFKSKYADLSEFNKLVTRLVPK
jgi:hypothetical protein